MTAIYQGEIATDGSTRIVCTGSFMNINNIIITNLTSNYTLTLNRTSLTTSEFLVPIYEFQLDAGDTIRDTEIYPLLNNDSLQLISDVPGTTFYINSITS
jgi:hypothetical protein